MGFERNVFVNCPFDKRFQPLLRPLLFTIIYLGLQPRIALERTDSGESRLDKILELIRESKYSIHDLSRSEANAADYEALSAEGHSASDIASLPVGGLIERMRSWLVR
jgi:hypothetical protein